jgi:hypothetical protein
MYRSAPFRSLVLSLLASTAFSGQAAALEPSGSAVNVDPAVSARGGEGSRLLEIKGAVFMGDEIVAGPNGLAQIRFIDDTKLVIGPNSRLTIDKFVFNADNTAREVSIDMVKGAFRFISGNSPHQAYSLRTPTMTIGVRGTIVDINARGADSSAVFLDGSGPICDNGGTCIIAIDDCALHVVPTSGGVATATGLERQQRLSAFFPFISGQGALDPAFRANISSCEVADNRLLGPPSMEGSDKTDNDPYQ